jgi:hypothetical protein
MGVPIFDVETGTESKLEAFLKSRGYVMKPSGELKRTNEGIGGVEQYWSVIESDREVFSFSIFDSANGKRALIYGPGELRSDIPMLLEAQILKLGGKRVKGLNNYL